MYAKIDADRQRKIFSKNLNYYMERSGKNTADLAADLSFPFSTVSDWVHGKKYPRMDKVQALADYFGILKSSLTEEQVKPNAQAEELPNAAYREVLSEGGMRILLDADSKISEEDIGEIIQIVRMKQRKYEE